MVVIYGTDVESDYLAPKKFLYEQSEWWKSKEANNTFRNS